MRLESSTSFDEKVQEETLSLLQHKCLSQIGAFLNDSEFNQGNASKLDLYLTAHQLHRIVITSLDISGLRTEIKRFFSGREHFLHGESLDYSHHIFSGANQLCIHLATHLFTSQKPENILFANTLIEGRRHPWMDPINLENDLPAFPFFFRSRTGRVELYECILEQAVANLKRGMNTPETIWRGTDMHDSISYSLSKEDLEILKQRTTSFKRLVEYSVVLNKAKILEQSDRDIYGKFHALRQALKRNDSHGGSGSNDDAGTAVYADIQVFVVWWHKLGQTDEGKRIQEKICQIDNMKHVLDNLFITCEKPNKKSHNPGPCIGRTGNILEEILSSEQNRDCLYALGKQIDVRISERELDALRQSILEELMSSFPVEGMRNVMNSYDVLVSLTENSPILLNEICNFTFEQLSTIKHFLAKWCGILKSGIASVDSGKMDFKIGSHNLCVWIRLLNRLHDSVQTASSTLKPLLRKFLAHQADKLWLCINDSLNLADMLPAEFSDLLLFMIHLRTLGELHSIIQKRTPHWSMQHLMATIRHDNAILFEQIVREKNMPVDASLLDKIILSKSTRCLEALLRYMSFHPRDVLALLYRVLWHDLDVLGSSSTQQLLFQLTGKVDVYINKLSLSEQARRLGINEEYISKIDHQTAGFAKANQDEWYPVTIVQKKRSKIYIHYQGYDHKYDRWIERDSERFRALDKSGSTASSFPAFCAENPALPAEVQIVGYFLQSDEHETAFALLHTLRVKELINHDILMQHLPALVALGANIHLVQSLLQPAYAEAKQTECDFLSLDLALGIVYSAISADRQDFLLDFIPFLSSIPPSGLLSLLHVALSQGAQPLALERMMFLVIGKTALTPKEQASRLGIDEEYGLKIDNQTAGFAKDNLDKWYPVIILKEKGSKIYIHYQGWDKKWDQWIERDSERFRALDRIGNTVSNFPTFCAANPGLPADLQIVGYLLQSDTHDTASALLHTLRVKGLIDHDILMQHLPALVALGADIHLVQSLLQSGDAEIKQAECDFLSPDLALGIVHSAISAGRQDFLLDFIPFLSSIPPSDLLSILHVALFQGAQPLALQRMICLFIGKTNATLTTGVIRVLTPKEQANQLGIDETHSLKIDNQTAGFAKDNLDKWYPVTILKEKGSKVYIHYQGWDKKWDEWIERNGERFRAMGQSGNTVSNFPTFCAANPRLPSDLQIIGYLLQSDAYDTAFALLHTLRVKGLINHDILRQHLPMLVALGADIRFCHILSELMVPEEQLCELPFESDLIDCIMISAINNDHDTFLDAFIQVCPKDPKGISFKWFELALALDKPRCLEKLANALSHPNIMIDILDVMELISCCLSKKYSVVALNLWTVALNKHPDFTKANECLLSLIRLGADRCFLDVFSIHFPNAAKVIFDDVLFGAEKILPCYRNAFQWGVQITLPEVLLSFAVEKGRWQFVTEYLKNNPLTHANGMKYLTLTLQKNISDGELSVQMAANAINALIGALSSPYDVLEAIKYLQKPFRILEDKAAARNSFGLFHRYSWEGSLTSKTWHDLVKKAKQRILHLLNECRQIEGNMWDHMEVIESFLAEPTGRVSALIGIKTESLKEYQRLYSGKR